MWVMTSFGILMPSIRPPQTVPKDDNRTIQVRARRKQDLEVLRDEYMGDQLGPILATPEMDYNYRAYCTPEAWGRALYDMALEIDYEKFKPTTSRYDNGAELHSVYNSIWGTVCSLNAPWGGRSWSSEAWYAPVDRVYATDPKPKPLGIDGYKVVAGPPKQDSKPKGYVWDRKEDPEPEPEFEDGTEDAQIAMSTDDEFVFDVLNTSEEEWDFLLTDAEKRQVMAKLRASLGVRSA